MNPPFGSTALRLVSALVFLTLLPVRLPASARGSNGIAATVQPLATDAAIAAMKKGGNAIDAAVAAALTLGVVDGHNSGIGGGCFLLIRLASGEIVAIDGRETAPLGATRDLFLRAGKADPRLSQTGALAAAVPGALAAYDHAVRNYGKLSLKTHLLAAAQIAEDGFHLNGSYARRIAATADDLKQFPSSRAVYFRSDGKPFEEGELFRQPDLAKTYRAIAEVGLNWFYRGRFAALTAAWMSTNGGVMTAKDFETYEIKLREPIRTTYRGYEIAGFPPPSSGGVHVAQILNILESFDLKKMGTGSADFIHVVTESMKLAFADRAHWLGDPDFAPVPRGLVSNEYAAGLARQIRLDHAATGVEHGIPAQSASDIFGKHTTHFSAADAAGNWVACTATINTSFGSKVVVPGTGVVLNNQMDDFSAQPGATNYFGLVGAEANAVGPGKRPLSSMSPTIVLKVGRPVLSVGAAGGPTIISQTVLAILNVIDFEMPVDQALAQPRFHHQWRPDELKLEKRASNAVVQELEKRGHKVTLVDALGAAQAVGVEAGTKRFLGAHDPRLEGKAAGF
ncbi:MAG TPA: gamma-glutamyltransferase [Candidatus Eisenbacteria bacterium]|nr:gamma-glutamyltransferase [Candidatus Eisenbacteria bacterium]